MDHSLTVVLLVFDEGNQGPVVLYEELVRGGNHCKFVYYLKDDAANRAGLEKLLRSLNVAFIGFSFASHSAKTAFSLSAHLSCEFPEIPIIFGGVHPTIAPLSCLEHCSAVCVGEGEEAILEVLEKIEAGQDYLSAHNLVYKQAGKVVRNALNPLLADLDKLPFRRPYTDDHMIIEKGAATCVDANKYFEIFPSRRYDYVQVFSRGCPYSCSYCCNSMFSRLYSAWPKVRSNSVDAIINEVCANIELNKDVIRVFIIDDCFFTHDVDYLEHFVKEWRQKVNKPVCFLSIPAYINRQKLAILSRLDIGYIDLGLQSGSKKINSLYNRTFSKESFLDACRTIQSFNINLCVDILVDNPWEDEADYSETLDILTQIRKPFLIKPFSVKIYPGTKLFEDCLSKNISIPDYNTSSVDFHRLQNTSINNVLVISQIFPRKIILFLFKNRTAPIVKFCLDVLYMVSCIFIIPILGILVVGPKGFRERIAFFWSFRKIGLLWLRNLIRVDR